MALPVIEITSIALLLAILAVIILWERTMRRNEVPRAQIDAYWRGRERRKHYRLKKTLDATYALERKPHIRMRGVMADISEGGLRLVIDAKLAIGEIVDLKVELAGAGAMVEVEGKVVWSDDAREYDDPSGKRLFYAGVQFCGINAKDAAALASYIRANTSEERSPRR